MLKYYDYATTMAEFPDEISLSINISNCPGNCGHTDENGKFHLDCSEPWLLEDVGEELTEEKIDSLISKHPGITVFGLMGGDSDHKDVVRVANYIHEKYPELKVGMYSGREFLDMDLLNSLDLYKIGRWIMPKGPVEEWKNYNCGPIVLPISNQLLFEKVINPITKDVHWVNVTYKFRKNVINDWTKTIIYNND